MHYGLTEVAKEIREYILGNTKVPYIPYQEDGNWEPYLPKYELQSDKYETCCCTVWGTQNQIEILYKRLFNIEPNYSERFNAARLQIRCPGIDPQKVYEQIRTEGLVDAPDFPMPDTHAEFLDQSEITGSILAKGQRWLQKHEFKHEWLWNTPPQNYLEVIKDALKTSPVAISVTAWHEENGVYVDRGQKNNHWVVCYRIDNEGIHVFDTYNHTKKTLAFTHKIVLAKRIWLNRKTKSSLRRHRNILLAIVERLMQKPTLLSVCEDHLGKDASPSDKAPDELGCAETVTTLVKKIYPETPIITGTWTLWDYLNNPKNGWNRVTVPTPETIIISPTVPGRPFPGHVGIFMDDMTIASNDSRTGKFIKNYTLETWYDRYVTKGGYQIYMYDRVA